MKDGSDKIHIEGSINGSSVFAEAVSLLGLRARNMHFEQVHDNYLSAPEWRVKFAV